MHAPMSPSSDDLADLYARPGFLIRRTHQLSSAFFDEAVASVGVTTTQFGVLHVVRARPGVDQIGLGQLLGIDRSTVTLVVGLLEQNGYLRREVSADDRRRKVLQITDAGRDALERATELTRASRHRILSPLTAEEAQIFMVLLGKIVNGFGEAAAAGKAS
jgi:DNA-binding MarR family transcriptional regulator